MSSIRRRFCGKYNDFSPHLEINVGKNVNSGISWIYSLVDEVAQEHIKNIFQTAENVLYSADFTGEDGWRNYIDEDAAIDWYIMNEFAKNNDAIFYSSVYIRYNPTDGKLYMGPNWDFDISCGNINYNGCDNPEGFWIKTAKWITRMFQDPDFVTHLKARWNNNKTALYNTLLDDGLIQTLADVNATSAELNFIKWQILGKTLVQSPLSSTTTSSSIP